MTPSSDGRLRPGSPGPRDAYAPRVQVGAEKVTVRRWRSTAVTSRPALSQARACTCRPSSSFDHHAEWRSAEAGRPPTRRDLLEMELHWSVAGAAQVPEEWVVLRHGAAPYACRLEFVDGAASIASD